MKAKEILQGHFYLLKHDGKSAKVVVNRIISEHYAEVQQPGKKDTKTLCATFQLKPL